MIGQETQENVEPEPRIRPRHRRHGLSLLELLASLTIMGVLAAVLIPRISVGTSATKSGSCRVNREVIEVQSALWHRSHGSWPTSNLSNVGADRAYFPEGLPTCPVDQSNYQIDSATGKVIGHNH